MKRDAILYESRWRWLIWLVSAAVLCGLMSRSVSPLFCSDGWDSAVYRMVGECWLRGALPYADVFDNKGPYLYLIQAIGAWLGGGRWGIFLLLVINYTVILELLWRITGLIFNKIGARLVVVAGFMLHFLLMLEQGNLTEDWSMALILLGLWLAMRRLAAPADLQIGREVYVYGLCFGVVTLMRPTNSIVFAAIVLGFSGLLLYRKQFRTFGIAALRFIAGAAAAIAPMAVYFYCHDALDDAIHCVFTYNILYAQIWSELTGTCYRFSNYLLMLPAIIPLASSLIYDRKNHSRFSVVVIPATILFCLIHLNQATYYHYYALLTPMLAVGGAMILRFRKPFLTAACAVLFIPTCYFARGEVTELWKSQPPTLQYIDGSYNGMERWAELIPQHERHDVMLFDTDLSACAIYHRMRTKPPMRFTHLTTQLMAVDPAIHTEVDDYLRHNDPLWILTSAESTYPLMQQKLEHYTLIAEDSHHRLYRQLKE
ncbi:MAG: hypothetical protein ACI4AM_02590 [Muribaculaceae bacterium]